MKFNITINSKVKRYAYAKKKRQNYIKNQETLIFLKYCIEEDF